MADPLLIARDAANRDLVLLPRMANRHGLVAGATGTGKTVTIHALAARFSEAGVPVFLADVKGDLAGISRPGTPSPQLEERLRRLGLAEGWTLTGFPVVFWDVFGEQGHPVRATVSEMGPLLLGRLLGLNETQSGVLHLVFKYADDQGLLLLDLKDLRAMLRFVGEQRGALTMEYGNVAPQTIGAIQRGLLRLEEAGGDRFFGEPALNLHDLMRRAPDGRGIVNILAADKLLHQPTAYATLLLWLLAELFEELPEVGDPEQPKLGLVFDEAHLLFADAPKALQDKIEQVVRLIRSKGVGVYFVSQSPLDIPEVVLGQLGNRIQHALRAYTPRDQKAVRTAAETFRPNPRLDTAAAITELAVGEALVSLLDAAGSPGVVERAWIVPPPSRLGPITPAERRETIEHSLLYGYYERTVDRASAYEALRAKAAARAAGSDGGDGAEPTAPAKAAKRAQSGAARASKAPRPATAEAPPTAGAVQTAPAATAAVEPPAAPAGRPAGRSLWRNLLGALTGRD